MEMRYHDKIEDFSEVEYSKWMDHFRNLILQGDAEDILPEEILVELRRDEHLKTGIKTYSQPRSFNVAEWPYQLCSKCPNDSEGVSDRWPGVKYFMFSTGASGTLYRLEDSHCAPFSKEPLRCCIVQSFKPVTTLYLATEAFRMETIFDVPTTIWLVSFLEHKHNMRGTKPLGEEGDHSTRLNAPAMFVVDKASQVYFSVALSTQFSKGQNLFEIVDKSMFTSPSLFHGCHGSESDPRSPGAILLFILCGRQLLPGETEDSGMQRTAGEKVNLEEVTWQELLDEVKYLFVTCWKVAGRRD